MENPFGLYPGKDLMPGTSAERWCVTLWDWKQKKMKQSPLDFKNKSLFLNKTKQGSKNSSQCFDFDLCTEIQD